MKNSPGRSTIAWLRGLISPCSNRSSFEARLQSVGVTSYVRRGKLQGVVFKGKKYRLSTLGLAKEEIKRLRDEREPER